MPCCNGSDQSIPPAAAFSLTGVGRRDQELVELACRNRPFLYKKGFIKEVLEERGRESAD